MARIFISYKRVDKDKVFKIKDQIESELGEKCWMDLDAIESDAQFVSVIVKAIDKAEVVLFMYSNAHTRITDYENDWTIRELTYASGEGKHVVFINIDGAPVVGWFRFMYGGQQHIPVNDSILFNRLITDLRNWLIIDEFSSKNKNVKLCVSDGNTIQLSINNVTINLKKITKGSYLMGGTPEQADLEPDPDEFPIHKVVISKDFYLGETTVTQALWNSVMEVTRPNDDIPVTNVTWQDCQTFIATLNKLVDGHFRLPTEAEWEYAARGGILSKGFKFSGSNNPDRVAWYDDNANHQAHTVKSLEPNELGLYDMSGNVVEWCHDWFGKYDNDVQIDPKGPDFGTERVYRGGSWYDDVSLCGISTRDHDTPDTRYSFLGFRLALDE